MSFNVDTVLPPGPLAAGDAAPRMEALGFQGLYTTETTSDPFLDLMLPATNTTTPILGTNLAIAFARSPFVTAVIAWKLQEALKGHIERRFGLKWQSPGPKFREYVQALRALYEAFQSGGQPAFRGKFYSHTLLTPFFRPGPIDHPAPPIWLAAVNEFNAETIGLVGDGILVHPVHSRKYFDDVLLPAIDHG